MSASKPTRSLPLLANALQHTSHGTVSAKLPPPLLGQHTHELLKNFAMLPKQEIKSLEDSGSIFLQRKDMGECAHDKAYD